MRTRSPHGTPSLRRRRALFTGSAAVLSGAALLLAAGCRTPAPETDRTGAVGFFGEALLHDWQGETDAALQAYRRTVDRDPTAAEAWERMFALHLRAGDLEQAADTAREYLRHTSDSPRPRILLAEALEAGGEREEALASLREAVHQFPSDPAPFRRLIAMHAAAGNWERATRWIDLAFESLDSPPADFYELRSTARIGGAAEEEDAAIKKAARASLEDLAEGLERYPRNPGLHIRRGETLLLLQSREEAAAAFERALEYGDERPEIRARLISIHLGMKRWDAAAEAARPLAERGDTRAADWWVLAGLGALQEGAAEQAAEILRDALALDPEHINAHVALGHAEAARERFAEAERNFAAARRALTSRDPGQATPELDRVYAFALMMQDKTERAADVLADIIRRDRASELGALLDYCLARNETPCRKQLGILLDTLEERFPDNPYPPFYRGYFRYRIEDFETAASAFERVTKLTRDKETEDTLLTAFFHYLYGSARERTGEADAAARLLRRAIDQDPEFAEAYNYLAYMWAEDGVHLDRALELAQKALKLEKDNGAYIDTLGWIYYRQGRYERAREQLERAARLMPDDPTILEHLGDALLKLDEPQLAVEYYLQAHRIDPGNASLLEKLRAQGIDP
ncbi:tetratricopeptide repeat protein [Kiritimatiella glycovorans]|uniref:tetratricopeptide repeat protein n=1 Tax=Kiritimatiella glycovorans TaxID=1307763 RepID=UPI003AACDD9A